MDKCTICGELTDECVPSPFLPYSGWRCEECQKKRRIPYDDLLMILHGNGTANSYEERLQEFKEWWKGSDRHGPDDGDQYAEKYWMPTAEFFGLSIEQAWGNAQQVQNK